MLKRLLKWGIPLAIVAGSVWLVTDPGVAWLHDYLVARAESGNGQYTELGLTHLGGFLLGTLRYDLAAAVLEDVMRLYPDGEHTWYNRYRLALVREKQGRHRDAVAILDEVIAQKAEDQADERIPSSKVLRLRRDKLAALHELEPVG